MNAPGESEALCARAVADTCAQSDLQPGLPTLWDKRACLNGDLVWNCRCGHTCAQLDPEQEDHGSEDFVVYLKTQFYDVYRDLEPVWPDCF